MQPYPHALDAILGSVVPLPTERVALELAAGRALARDFVSPVALPARDNSAMDGYAVRAADLQSASKDAPVKLAVVERITAADSPQRTLQAGQAARIMTGGALPAGADAVVMQEDVIRDADSALFGESVAVAENVRHAGDDVRAGSVALVAGQELGASELALLASLGETHLTVHRRPRVALLSTGDEIVEIGRAAPGKLVDSNAVALGIRLRQLGIDCVQLGVAGDDLAALRERFLAARGCCEVVISSAGVSVGEKDFVKEVLSGLGARFVVDGVAIRPGKPLVFATSETQFFFGLPGNPVSSRVTFEVFVLPAIRKLLGIMRPRLAIPAQLERDFPKPERLTMFARVQLLRDGARLLARPMPKQSSNYLTSLAGADGLAVLPAGHAVIAAGTPVDVIPL